jgi:tetratricopeptide (TPR) repeat protein
LEGIAIFEQLFMTMNELLTEISSRYGTATTQERINLDDQLAMLKKLSDEYMEQWLDFEEKLAGFYVEHPTVPASTVSYIKDESNEPPVVQSEANFTKAQGFYKLYMFEHAVKELETLIRQQPDDLLARMYLAMGYLRLGEDGDAYPHFQMILPMTENKQLKAISYNAMGCIQIKKKNLQKAMEYFSLSYQLDPACLKEPAGHVGAKLHYQQRLP